MVSVRSREGIDGDEKRGGKIVRKGEREENYI